jgi:hypothetical protein
VYFPKITRRDSYKAKANGEFYASYLEYYDEISEDCQYRCVYCDVMLKEIGGEGMHVDHFRPQKYFPELATIPGNLVLACQKCNLRKSNWWPEKTGTESNGKCGFVDPFSLNRHEYFSVDQFGAVVAGKQPAQYIIDLLILNRPTRCSIRRTRALKYQGMELLNAVEQEMEVLVTKTEAEIRARLPILSEALAQIRGLLNLI